MIRNILQTGIFIWVFALIPVGCKKTENPGHPVTLNIKVYPEGDTLLIGHPAGMSVTSSEPLQEVTLEFNNKSVVLTDTPYVYQWNTYNLEEGSYDFTVTATDKNGNPVLDSVEVYMQFARVVIGNQTWMKENLRRTIYSDGTPIEEVYVYNNDSSYMDTYGLLYSWHAVMHGEKSSGNNPSGVQGACPVGWHVPSREEFNEMVTYLGGENIAGGKMKETGYDHWASPNDGATNSSGFTGLAAGQRNANGSFDRLLKNAGFWSCTENPEDPATAIYQCLTAIHPITRQWTDPKTMGYSLRCVKNK